MHNKFFFILFGLLCLFVLTASVWAPASVSSANVSSSGGILCDEQAADSSRTAAEEWSCGQ